MFEILTQRRKDAEKIWGVAPDPEKLCALRDSATLR